MKVWIKAIFLLASKLGQLAAAIAEEMDTLSTDITPETFGAFDRMLTLEDRKRRVCNFKVFRDLLRAKLTRDEYELIKRHMLKGETFEEIAASGAYSKSALARKFNQAIDTCIELMQSLTYGEARLLKDYKDIPLIYKTVQMLQKARKISNHIAA